ncbi:hypothetical protein ScPMuIL_000815 [Solemya velum]
MKKTMFSKFTNITNILHQAVEALAPQLTLYEEFLFHWKAITSYFIDNREEKHQRPVEQTNIPAHLNQLLAILQEEETGSDNGAMGPCMEYLLQHKLLETLYSLSRTDHPPGMKQSVLMFFTKLLSRLKQPLLPHISVHRAVHRLVKICGEVKAAPTESDEIQFLCTVCAKIRSDPYLVNFFIEVLKKKQPGSCGEESGEKKLSSGGEYSLVKSLLSLTTSADGRVAVKACEGLMLCASLPEENAAHSLVSNTTFCNDLTEKLIMAYHKLPDTVDPTVLEDVEAKWGLDILTDRDDQQTFLGKRQLVSFLSWLDYCDQLIEISHPVTAKALAKCIRQNFLNLIVEPSILQQSECGAIISTAYLTRCLRTVCSQTLLSEFCHFILGDDRSPEVPGEGPHKLRQRLIERCDHLSDEMSLVTLKLFSTLLQKDDEHIFYNLILRNLASRSYFNCSDIAPEMSENCVKLEVTENCIAKEKVENSIDETSCSSSNTEETIIKNCDQNCSSKSPDDSSCEDGLQSSVGPDNEAKILVPEEAASNSDLSNLSTPTSSPGHRRTEVHKIVNSFLSLLPEELKSSYQTVDSGYDMYLRDAHKQFVDINAMCKSWNWPKQPETHVETESEEPSPFYEGLFFKTLLDRITRLLDQSYCVNLQLTSVIARLSLLPHPHLHEFLLDPFLPVTDGVRTLFSVFQKVATEIKQELTNHPDLTHRLGLTRKRLMGVTSDIHRLEGQTQLEAIIVLEEFCKELSAIAFVKHHAAVTQD